MDPIVVFGAAGQVGRAVLAAARDHAVPAVGYARAELDVTDPGRLAAVLGGASVAVNCAAITAVDDAERRPASAYAVNAGAVAAMAIACRAADVPLIHLSTDYVFDGSGDRPWRETDAASPINVYGASKFAGETALRMLWPRHVILRISWVFGATGRNFVRTILELAQQRERLRIVADQIGRPTPASACAEAIVTLARRCADRGFADWGTYHFAGEPAVSRCDFVRAILAGRASPTIEPVAAAAVADVARRPSNAVLDCSRIRSRLGLVPPSWPESLPAVRAAIEAQLDRASLDGAPLDGAPLDGAPLDGG